MNIFKKIFKWKKEQDALDRDDYLENEEAWNDTDLKRDSVNMYNKIQRTNYITTNLEQLVEASKKQEEMTYEYNLVTSYLQDIEEIEALPEDIRRDIDLDAKKIVSAEESRKQFLGKTNRMTDEQFTQIERLEGEVEEGLKKMKSAEEYQLLVRKDLSRLDSEKYAYQYRKGEVETSLANLKGMTMICLTALGVCIVMLLIMQFGFDMDTRLGYLLTVAAAAITLTVIFIKNGDTGKELLKIENTINKIITLQNKVKIRYVNNTQLINYLYLKFSVSKSSELELLWEKFGEEKEERQKYAQAEDDLDYYRKSLVKGLAKFRIKDPGIWVRQAVALVNPKEMVEIRHSLIGRRQALRKQMDYNKEVAVKAQQEVKELAEEYPQYAPEIMEMIAEYEKKYNL